MDHKHQIAKDPFKRNGKDNLVGLCTECHLEKTMAQGGTDFSGARNVNEHFWKHFIMNGRPHQHIQV